MHFRKPAIVCPHCDYELTTDDMLALCDAGTDVFGMAPSEEREAIDCPSCDKNFWVQGGYTPEYTTAFAEEEL